MLTRSLLTSRSPPAPLRDSTSLPFPLPPFRCLPSRTFARANVLVFSRGEPYRVAIPVESYYTPFTRALSIPKLLRAPETESDPFSGQTCHAVNLFTLLTENFFPNSDFLQIYFLRRCRKFQGAKVFVFQIRLSDQCSPVLHRFLDENLKFQSIDRHFQRTCRSHCLLPHYPCNICRKALCKFFIQTVRRCDRVELNVR